MRRQQDAKGFVLLPKRWVIERTFRCLGRWHRLSHDYEHPVNILQVNVESGINRTNAQVLEETKTQPAFAHRIGAKRHFRIVQRSAAHSTFIDIQEATNIPL